VTGPTVYFDTETGGLELRHPIIQLAAVVVAPDWSEVETFERKVRFDPRVCDARALEVNHYTAEAWADAVPEQQAVREFAALLERHRSVDLISRAGKPWRAARIAGHNIGFDVDRVQAAFKRHGAFFAGDMSGAICTRYAATWALGSRTPPPANYQLSTLAAYLGIPSDGAHDALVDVRLSISIARRLRELSVATAA
jgi:DNA polymerase III epsilon subunit-like protein